MKNIIALVITLSLLLALSVLAADAPDTIVFQTKMGNVTFNHQAHVERAKNECSTCHDSLFPQSREPINFKAGMHRPAEANKTSCGHCHNPEGPAFETKGNCNKCHVK